MSEGARHDEAMPMEARPEWVCLPAYAIEHERQLSKLQHQIELMEASRGALNASSIRTILTMVGVLTTIGTGIAAMWLQNSTEPTRSDLSGAMKDIQTLQRDLERDEELTKNINSTVRTIQAETLRTEDVEQRLRAIQVQVNGQDGKFARIVEKRLEPRIKRDEARLLILEKKVSSHLEDK